MTCCTQSSTSSSPDLRHSSGLGGGSYAESMPVKPEIETRQACQLKRQKEIKASSTLTTSEQFQNHNNYRSFGKHESKEREST